MRGEGLDEDRAARIAPFAGRTSFESDVGRAKESLVDALMVLSNTRLMPDNSLYGVNLSWGEVNFAGFAFDIVALLNGTFRPRYVSSFHGQSWLNPNRNRRRPSGPGRRFTD